MLPQVRANLRKMPKATGSYNYILLEPTVCKHRAAPLGYKGDLDASPRELPQSQMAGTVCLLPFVMHGEGQRAGNVTSVSGSTTHSQRSQLFPPCLREIHSKTPSGRLNRG